MRLRVNFIEGVLAVTALVTDTTLTSDIFEYLPVVDALEDDYMVLVVGDEVVYITEHTANSDTVTVTRGEEGTAAQEWEAATPVHHGPTTLDYPVILTQAEYDALTPPIDGVFYVIVEE